MNTDKNNQKINAEQSPASNSDTSNLEKSRSGTSKLGVRDLLGGGFRLFFFGGVILALIEFLLLKQLALMYPYISPELITGLTRFAYLCFFVPGGLFWLLSPWGKFLDPPQTNKLALPLKILFLLAAFLACGGILGIRSGMKIILAFVDSKKPTTTSEASEDTRISGWKAYRLYLDAGTLYLLAFGLFFLWLIDFLLVITIDLAYPTLTQTLLIGIEIWVYLCLILPAALLFSSTIWLKLDQPAAVRVKQFKLIKTGAILAILSLFGLSIGVNLIKNHWMVQNDVPTSSPKAMA